MGELFNILMRKINFMQIKKFSRGRIVLYFMSGFISDNLTGLLFLNKATLFAVVY